MLNELKRETEILRGAVKCLDEIRYGDTALMNLELIINAARTIKAIADKEHMLLSTDMKIQVK